MSVFVIGIPCEHCAGRKCAGRFGRAGELVDVPVTNRLDSSCIDQDIRGTQTAYDDELREIWSKLISQEVSTGRVRSKRTKALLEQMDVEDANQPLSVLSCCLWTPVGPELHLEPISLLFKTSDDDSWTYNGGMISAETIGALDSLGVLVSGK